MNGPGVSRAQAGSWPSLGVTDRKRREQGVGIVFDRRDAMVGEEIRRQTHHHFAVLEHVGHTRRGPYVVLEDVEIIGVDAHHVDAGDVHVDVVRHLLTDHLPVVVGVRLDDIARQNASLDDLLRPVNVAVRNRLRALTRWTRPGLELHPLGPLNHPRYDVERE